MRHAASCLVVTLLWAGAAEAANARNPLPNELVRVEREWWPKLPQVADTVLWRRALRSGVVYGAAKEPVFARATTPRGRAALEHLGVVPTGAWQLVRLNGAQLFELLEEGHGLELAASPAHRPLLDYSGREVGAVDVRVGGALKTSYTGKGVLVGIIDTGLDLHHTAFLDARARSRVVAVWDQDAARGNPPDGFDYGNACDAADIVAMRCDIDDPVGHGTHVAGIAAGGNGLAGMAPSADIAVVRSDAFTRMADAVSFLIELADERDQPLVINMSVGGQYGPHDGRTPLESFLADQAREGVVLVAAAGNDGESNIHVGAELGPIPQRVAIAGLPPPGRPVDTFVELWSAPLAPTSLAVELWRGGELLVRESLVASDSDLVEVSLATEDGLLARVAYSSDMVLEHRKVRHGVIIDRRDAVPWPADAMLALSVQGSGWVDAWISQSDYRAGSARFATAPYATWLSGDGARSLAVPATSPDVITVGAYMVRTEWQSEDHAAQHLTVGAVGELASYSSRGPAVDASHAGYKPDLCAPGSVILSARAMSVAPSALTIDDERMAMQGTSMAAPHVAGVVALMLEANPRLTTREVREILQNTSRGDERTGEVPNDAWGYGRLDALAAVAAAEHVSRQRDGCAAAEPAWWPLLALWALGRRRRSC